MVTALCALLVLVPILLTVIFTLKRNLASAQQRIEVLEWQKNFQQKRINLLSQQVARLGGTNNQRPTRGSARSRRRRGARDDRTRRESATGSAVGLAVGTALGTGSSLF